MEHEENYINLNYAELLQISLVAFRCQMLCLSTRAAEVLVVTPKQNVFKPVSPVHTVIHAITHAAQP